MRRLPALTVLASIVLASTALASLIAATPVLANAENGPGSHSATSGKQRISQEDQHWLDYAATDNQGEIQESLLAEKKAHSLALKAFVRLMVDDHVQLESQLAALVNGESVSVPVGPGQKAEQLISELKPLHGEQFDRRFIQDQIKDHNDDIQKYSAEIQRTNDPAIRAFAAESLPILKQHLALAEAVDKSLGDNSAQAAGLSEAQAH